MKTRSIVINILLSLALDSCSNYNLETKPIEINFNAVRIFSNQVNSRFQDYAVVSGYNHFRDSLNIAMLYVRDWRNGEPFIILRGQPSIEEIVIYTFDKKDSCIIFSGMLLNENYTLHLNSLPIPIGKYLLKTSDVTISFNRE